MVPTRIHTYIYTQEDARVLHEQVRKLVTHVQSLLHARRHPNYVSPKLAARLAEAAWRKANEIQLQYYPEAATEEP